MRSAQGWSDSLNISDKTEYVTELAGLAISHLCMVVMKTKILRGITPV